MSVQKPLLIAITGPTAVGKTSLCIELAQQLDIEILSCDARQVFKELNIGVARPTIEELAAVPHHFIANKSIHQAYSAGQFGREVLSFLEQYFKSKQAIIMTGGSGLYIKAVLYGFDEFPDVPEGIRQQLNEDLEKHGIDFLVKELEEKDPEYAKLVDRYNSRRLIRALEICRSTGQPYSFFRSKKKRDNFFDHLLIGLQRDRTELYTRINQRVNLMLTAGLLEEAKQLHIHKDLNALQTVGYQELFAHFEGETSLQEATQLIQQNTRRYAKRQTTWIRKEASEHLFHPSEAAAIMDLIKTRLSI